MSLKSAEIFQKMGAAIGTHGKPIVDKIQAVFLFEIRATKDAQPQFFTIDLKNGTGKFFFQYIG